MGGLEVKVYIDRLFLNLSSISFIRVDSFYLVLEFFIGNIIG